MFCPDHNFVAPRCLDHTAAHPFEPNQTRAPLVVQNMSFRHPSSGLSYGSSIDTEPNWGIDRHPKYKSLTSHVWTIPRLEFHHEGPRTHLQLACLRKTRVPQRINKKTHALGCKESVRFAKTGRFGSRPRAQHYHMFCMFYIWGKTSLTERHTNYATRRDAM